MTSKPKSERDIIEQNIANDPLWAAQEIVDHGSRTLIAKLTQAQPEELEWEQWWKDSDEAYAAYSPGRHEIKVGKRTVQIPVGALGCCIQKLYCRMRDDAAPIKNGEHFVCHPECRPTMADEWIFTDGSFKSIRDTR